MKTEFLFKAAAAVVAGVLISATPSLADPPSWAGHGHWQSEDEGYDHHDHEGDDRHDMDDHQDRDDRHEEHHHHHHHHDKVVIVDRDRDVIREYIGHHRDRWCPPGLARKHDGCMPPGQLRYQVGEVLPGTVRYEVLPATVVRTFAPLPPADMYVRVGGDVYVMDKTDRTILDAVTLLNDLR